MDIRTKLVFALVAVSLGSMFVLGAVVSPRVEGYIRSAALQQLDQLAEAHDESVHRILDAWRDRTELVASRTQLRVSLDSLRATGDTALVAGMRTILEDAMSVSDNATLYEVRGLDGARVVSVRRGSPAQVGYDALPGPGTEEAVYAGVTTPEGAAPQVTFVAPMSVEDRRVGALVAVFEALELLELAGNRHGLGETGELLIVTRDATGAVRTLHPTRFGDPSAGPVRLASGAGSLAVRAFDESGVVGDPVPDYRGEPVWAATRVVGETGWGLLVKLDRTEGMSRVGEFNEWLRRTSLVLAAFAIVVGLVLALRFAHPIHALSEVANSIRKGEMDARADAAREDEVGLLARTFNDMADELERRMEQLKQFRRFFDVSIDLMCIAGTDGYFKKTNPAFEQELGWSTDELRERPFFDFVHPDDVAKTRQEVAKLGQGIPTVSFENRYLCKDGSYKLLRWTSYPEDGVLYAIAHVVDRAPAA